jgi:DNA-3-methyladenine glycosylase
VFLLVGEQAPSSPIRITSRVGVANGVERPWRFFVEGDPFVSRGRPSEDREVRDPSGS